MNGFKRYAKNKIVDENLGDRSINDIVKLYNKLKEQGLSKEDIIKEIEKLDESILTEANGTNKVIIRQKMLLSYEADIDYNLNKEDIEYNIDFDDKKFSEELLKYFNDYNIDDEYKDVYKSVTRVEADFDGDKLTIYLTIGSSIDDDQIYFVFDNFIEEVALEDDQFSGTCSVEVDEFESDPYESGFNPLTDTIEYSTSTINEIDVDYSYKAIEEQTIEIQK